MSLEQWRPIAGYVGVYEVSDQGRVRRLPEPRRARQIRVLKERFDKKGYVRVALHYNGRKDAAVHRLVAFAFIGDPPTPAHQVNHIDGIKRNNAVTNLEWATGAENLQHSYRIGLHVPIAPDRASTCKLTWGEVDRIRKSSATGLALAAEFGVSNSLIYAIRSHQVWKEDRRPGHWEDGTIRDTLARLAKPRPEAGRVVLKEAS